MGCRRRGVDPTPCGWHDPTGPLAEAAGGAGTTSGQEGEPRARQWGSGDDAGTQRRHGAHRVERPAG